MSNTFPPRPPRRLPLMWAGLVVVAASAAGLWVWLGQLVPQQPPLVLASAQSDRAISAGVPSAVPAASSPIVVRAEPVPPPPAAIRAPVPTPLPDPVPAPTLSQDVATGAPPPSPAPAPPPAPVGAVPIRPSFDIVRVTPRGEAVLAGRTAPGATVTITDNGRKIAEAVGDKEGQWVALPENSLPEGGQQLALSSAAKGEVPVAGEAPLLVIVPAVPNAAVGNVPSSSPSGAAPGAAIVPPQDGPQQPAVAILTPLNAAPRVLQGLPDAPAPRAGRSDHAAPGRLGLDIVDYDEHGAIRFGGTAPPGTTVRTYVDNKAAGDATVDADGHWSVDPADPIAPGGHRLRVDQVGGSTGKVAARVELPFERTSMAAAELREGRIVVQPRATLWRIARRFYGQGVRYTVIYQANRDQIVDPDRIFPGQIFAIPASSAALPAK